MDDIQMMESNCKAEIVEILLEQETIEGKVAGVARQYLAGEKPLSVKQQFIFDNEIRPHFSLDCSRHGGPLTTQEIVDAMREMDELCVWCRHLEEKMNED